MSTSVGQRGTPQHLLARILRDEDDDEYALAAASPQRPPPKASSLVAFGAVIAVGAVLVTVSALQARASEPQDAADREALVQSIEAEQAQVARFSAQVDTLGSRLDALRGQSAELSASLADTESRLDEVAAAVGAEAVEGPGVRVTVDDAASGTDEGTILDTDLQLLVNGLWQAGAEAVAINGQRLTTLTAIRTAGQAITVNFRSLSPPYVVSAIGDPDVLPANLLDTVAGQTFTDLAANFGIGFGVEARDDLQLPAGSGVVLRQATSSAAGPDRGDEGAS